MRRESLGTAVALLLAALVLFAFLVSAASGLCGLRYRGFGWFGGRAGGGCIGGILALASVVGTGVAPMGSTASRLAASSSACLAAARCVGWSRTGLRVLSLGDLGCFGEGGTGRASAAELQISSSAGAGCAAGGWLSSADYSTGCSPRGPGLRPIFGVAGRGVGLVGVGGGIPIGSSTSAVRIWPCWAWWYLDHAMASPCRISSVCGLSARGWNWIHAHLF